MWILHRPQRLVSTASPARANPNFLLPGIGPSLTTKLPLQEDPTQALGVDLKLPGANPTACTPTFELLVVIIRKKSASITMIKNHPGVFLEHSVYINEP